MVSHRFGRLRKADGDCSPNLYVANCGPAVGLSFDSIAAAFGEFGEVRGVYDADETGTRVIVAFREEAAAAAAFEFLNGKRCGELNGRVLHIRYSMLKLQHEAHDRVPVSLEASEMNIPGLYLWHDFVSCEEEEKLLREVDDRPWKNLAKRRVQHYGYEFCYNTRNINTTQRMGELPSFLTPVLRRISLLPELDAADHVDLDQVTVNEYPIGVGLAPHIDTHSAFEGLIFSLSLAGPCIMEFRRYPDGLWISRSATSDSMEVSNTDSCSNYTKKILYLPRRSMLLLSGEARYAWHHYIPHHKVDIVNDDMVRRESRRVSFTIRKVRPGSCQCEFTQYCDSQKGM
uniref:Uncharacterized protein n=1 Tax=Kalanchoe fedtschenkoi TaxID=63787 RepID=A0A7N0V8Y8_KALFE